MRMRSVFNSPVFSYDVVTECICSCVKANDSSGVRAQAAEAPRTRSEAAEFAKAHSSKANPYITIVNIFMA